MDIRKAIITAAGPDQRHLPLQKLVDRDGVSKPALRIALAEVLTAGIEECGIVIHPGDREAFTAAAGDTAGKLTFLEQPQPLGYGHALSCARDFIGGEKFFHCVADHLFVDKNVGYSARRLLNIATAENTAVSAVQATRENMLPLYGTIGGQRIQGHDDLYEVRTVREKPTPTEAEQDLMIPGLRAGHYLCFYGMHVLPAGIFDLLQTEIDQNTDQRETFSKALAQLAARERYLAQEATGTRYDIGAKYGLLHTQLALALSGCERELVTNQLLQMLITRERDRS